MNNRPLTVIGIAPDDAAGDPIAAMAYVPYTRAQHRLLEVHLDYDADATIVTSGTRRWWL